MVPLATRASAIAAQKHFAKTARERGPVFSAFARRAKQWLAPRPPESCKGSNPSTLTQLLLRVPLRDSEEQHWDGAGQHLTQAPTDASGRLACLRSHTSTCVRRSAILSLEQETSTTRSSHLLLQWWKAKCVPAYLVRPGAPGEDACRSVPCQRCICKLHTRHTRQCCIQATQNVATWTARLKHLSLLHLNSASQPDAVSQCRLCSQGPCTAAARFSLVSCGQTTR